MKTPALILICLLILLPTSSVGADQLKDGIDAYFKGNNTQAISLLRPLAEQGNEEAQYHLGVMYQKGQGLQQDYTQAALWYRKAAEQGDTMAQAALSNLYVTGRGVPQDYILGYMWINLAVALHPTDEKSEKITELRESIAILMTPAEITEARMLSRDRFEKIQQLRK
jgi:hypothetical protein